MLFISVPATLVAQKKQSFVYPVNELQYDLKFLHSVLESNHPGLYWYTTKTQLDSSFNAALNSMPDSMSEAQYKNLLSKIIAEIRCGHTAVKFSKSYLRQEDKDSSLLLPFDVRVWKDTMVVSGNIKCTTTAIQKGTRITSINGRQVPDLLKELYKYMSCDGYAVGVNEVRLSYAFPAIYNSIFGDTAGFELGYINEEETEQLLWVPPYIKPAKNDSTSNSKTASKQAKKKRSKEFKAKRLLAARSLRIDTATNAGILQIASFSKGFKLKQFYRSAFHSIRTSGVQDLIIDVRNNGGGYLSNYIKLAQYLSVEPFRVADSITAVSRKLPKGRYLEASTLNQFIMFLSSPKKKDGLYHFKWFEKEVYKPSKKNHFNGNIYILISGHTFSAATLFTSTLKGQENCTVIGEETGGGAYGNNGMLIPSLTLPNTKIRVSLPLYKMVINKEALRTGRGIQPDVEVLPTIPALKSGVDLKLDRTLELIKKRRIKDTTTQTL